VNFFFQNDVIQMHPFEWQFLSPTTGIDTTLVSWKEIREQEYNLFKENKQKSLGL
jgi:hypothetical protein